MCKTEVVDFKDLEAFNEFRKRNPTIRCKNCAFATGTEKNKLLIHCENFDTTMFTDNFCGLFVRKEKGT